MNVITKKIDLDVILFDLLKVLGEGKSPLQAHSVRQELLCLQILSNKSQQRQHWSHRTIF